MKTTYNKVKNHIKANAATYVVGALGVVATVVTAAYCTRGDTLVITPQSVENIKRGGATIYITEKYGELQLNLPTGTKPI